MAIKQVQLYEDTIGGSTKVPIYPKTDSAAITYGSTTLNNKIIDLGNAIADQETQVSSISNLLNEVQSDAEVAKEAGSYKIIDSESKLDEIIEAGFYTYSIGQYGDTKYNLIVQEFPQQWVVQYKFTPNNIHRRYAEYVAETNNYPLWTDWYSIANPGEKYDPNTDYLCNGRSINDALNYTGLNGALVGNKADNNYTPISGSMAAILAYLATSQQSSKIKPEGGFPFIDGTLAEGSSSWKESGSIVTQKFVTFEKNNGGYNTGYGFYFTNAKITLNHDAVFNYHLPNEDDQELVIKITGTFYYKDGTLTANVATSSQEHVTTIGDNKQTLKFNGTKSSSKGHDSFMFKVKDFDTTTSSAAEISLITDTYFYCEKIEILPASVIDIIPGNTASLYYALKYAANGSTINIPEGTYNFGDLSLINNALSDNGESTPFAMTLKWNNVTIEGNNAIICGIHTETPTIQSALFKVEGDSNTFKNLTLLTVRDNFETKGQAPTLFDTGKDNAYINCNIYGGQDTIYTNGGSHLFYKCTIDGTVDFICGGATNVDGSPNLNKQDIFKECTLLLKDRSIGTAICAPRGVIAFDGCTIDDTHSYVYSQEGKWAFGRCWGNGAICVFNKTQINITPKSEPWESMASGVDFSDYGDVDNKRKEKDTITKTSYRRPTSSDTITQYTDKWAEQFENKDRVLKLVEEN